MEPKHRKIVHHLRSSDNADLFARWADTLDAKVFGIVENRLDRVKKGLLGDCHSVGQGVSELVIDFGPGYRVYFGTDGNLVILLNGGKKNTQQKDIASAYELWEEYKK